MPTSLYSVYANVGLHVTVPSISVLQLYESLMLQLILFPLKGNPPRRSIAEWEEQVSSSNDKILQYAVDAELLSTSGHTGRFMTKTGAQYHYAVRQATINSDILKSNSVAQTF